MSLQRACCCGEPEPCTVCECNTSYAVGGINLAYQFQRYKVGAPQACDCRFNEFNLNLTFAPAGPVTVTKVSGGGCCYRGRFNVNVGGFLDLSQHYDSGSYCPPKIDAQNAYQIVNTTTCACITVVCNSKVDVCNGSTMATSLVHTIEIGDFVIECNANVIYAGDCDSCPQQGSFALRCLGGRFQYSTDVGCLSGLSGVKFMGFYGNSQQFCGTGGPVENPGACYLNLESNIAQFGPFAVRTEEECSEQDKQQCIDPVASGAFLPTFNASWAESLRVSLQSPCGSTDWSGRLFPLSICPDEYDVLQSGAPGFWNYL